MLLYFFTKKDSIDENKGNFNSNGLNSIGSNKFNNPNMKNKDNFFTLKNQDKNKNLDKNESKLSFRIKQYFMEFYEDNLNEQNKDEIFKRLENRNKSNVNIGNINNRDNYNDKNNANKTNNNSNSFNNGNINYADKDNLNSNFFKNSNLNENNHDDFKDGKTSFNLFKQLSLSKKFDFEYVIKVILFSFAILLIVVMFVSYFVSLESGLSILSLFVVVALFLMFLPKIKKQNRYSEFSKELPYALRQLATELRSGKSLFDAMASVVDADYGILSFEFSRVLEEVKYGESSENAFNHLEKRVTSPGLSRMVQEILSSLRVGGNLANSLNIIAEDINFDMRMKLKEYSQKLNAFIMLYTFLAILAPVIILTMLLAASVVIGDVVPSNLILVLYSLFFPMVIVFLAFFIKKLEPKV